MLLRPHKTEKVKGENRMTNETQIKVKISGIVQGVFFRLETQKAANQFGVRGYVKNLPNGSVEAVFQGKRNQIDKILTWCHHGPDASRVDHVQQEAFVQTSTFESFEVQY